MENNQVVAEAVEAIAAPIRKLMKDQEAIVKRMDALENSLEQLREWVSHVLQDVIQGQ